MPRKAPRTKVLCHHCHKRHVPSIALLQGDPYCSTQCFRLAHGVCPECADPSCARPTHQGTAAREEEDL